MEAKELYLETPGRAPERCTVEAVQRHRRGVLIKVAGIDSRTDAEAWIGMVVSLPEDRLPAPGENEFYYYEMVGFRVRTTEGKELGRIRETFPTGSNDVWVVVDESREYLIPVIQDVVRTIDRPARTVTIEPMKGLLDQ
jgi:16S rRNA processing protein RimM